MWRRVARGRASIFAARRTARRAKALDRDARARNRETNASRARSTPRSIASTVATRESDGIVTMRADASIAASRRFFVVAFALAFALAGVARARAYGYDPCASSGERGIEIAGAVTIGLAFWPGGALERWDGYHPCAQRAQLAALGVGTTSFVMNSAELTALRGTRADEDGLYATNASATMMSVVAYTATRVSAPRAVRLEAAEPTNANGRSGRVNALTLLVTLDGGDVKYLRWHDGGCGACGGVGDARCLSVGDGDVACSASLAGCDGTCSGSACDVDLATADALRCQLTVTVATSGTDKNDEVFVLGSQLERLSMYASSGAYASASAQSTAAVTGVTGFLG